MTIWEFDLDKWSGPRYQAIANAIADAAGAGQLSPGERLPPQRELADRLGVTVGTVSRGYSLAEQRGLVRGEVGRGTYVQGNKNAGRAMAAPETSASVDLSINMPLADANASALADTLAQIASEQGVENLLRYMPGAGHESHREAAARWIARSGFEVEPDRIVLTEGAQQGLAACFDVLVGKGESILVESLTYSGLIEMARVKGIPLAAVPMDEEGMLPDALEQAAWKTGAKVVVVVPTIHNPSTAVMSEGRRRAIAEIAARCGLTIVEDDVYGYLLESRPPPIASLLPEQTIYVSSASKCLAPGLRVGWLAAAPRFVDRFTDLIYTQSVAQPALNHEIIRRWIESGTAARLVRELAEETSARHAIAMDALEGFLSHSNPASFHLMLELPAAWQSHEFVSAALERDVRISALTSFVADPGYDTPAVRLSLVAAEDRRALRQGLSVIRELLTEGPQAARRPVV